MGERPTCEMHIGHLEPNAKPCGKPATWRFESEVAGYIHACDDCIGAGRRYSQRIEPAHPEGGDRR